MRKITLIATLISFILNSSAQSPNWDWAKSAGGFYAEQVISTAIDASGNVYAVGYFGSSSVTFGSTVLNNMSTHHDIFIVKYTATGNVIWAKSAGGANADVPCSIVIDSSGYIYVGGSFSSLTLVFGTDTLINAGGAGNSDDMFIVKYDASGNVIWARSEGGYSNEDAYSIATDVAGDVYVTGNFYTPTFVFGNTTITNAGDFDIFIAKYDANGNFQWVRTSGGFDNDDGFAVTTDIAGNIYAAGWFASDNIVFGTTTLTRAGVGNFDVFLVKYTANGNFVWAKSAGSNNRESLRSISTDISGNIFIAGEFDSQTFIFASDTLMCSDTINYTYDIYLAKYDGSGNELWAKSASGNKADYVYSVTTDTSGNVFITGTFSSPAIVFDSSTLTNVDTTGSDIFIIKLDSAGSLLWEKSVGGSGGEFGYSVSVDVSENVYVGGGFNSPTLDFGTTTLTAFNNSDDMFLAKLNGVTGVEELQNNLSFSIAPNPFSTQTTIIFSSINKYRIATLDIIDVLGNIVSSQTIVGDTKQVQIDMSEYAKGLYFVQLQEENENMMTKKIVVQ